VLLAAVPLLASAAPPTGDVTATITDLRSHKGLVAACLTTRRVAFPDCEKDPDALALMVPASAHVTINFGRVPAGRYAIAVFHDENANGRLDKRLMMPREGYGFSRNAPVRLGPPSFDSAAFAVGEGDEHQSIRMRYMF
jgi:uncharacterized protein (DUF2141 family)